VPQDLIGSVTLPTRRTRTDASAVSRGVTCHPMMGRHGVVVKRAPGQVWIRFDNWREQSKLPTMVWGSGPADSRPQATTLSEWCARRQSSANYRRRSIWRRFCIANPNPLDAWRSAGAMQLVARIGRVW